MREVSQMLAMRSLVLAETATCPRADVVLVAVPGDAIADVMTELTRVESKTALHASNPNNHFMRHQGGQRSARARSASDVTPVTSKPACRPAR
jgi:predicted dinucleotide-binding enzyme